jgi:hypothetical protein
MATGKTSTLTFRIEPALKEALRAAAEREHRSIANMVEVLIRDWCGRNGIAIPEQAALFDEDREEPAVEPAGRRGRRA